MTIDDHIITTIDSTSFDLSEASSTDTEETDLQSNITKMHSTSPNDVRSYDDLVINNMNMNHQDNSVPRLGDPLPIVAEEKIMEEDTFQESNEYDGAVKAYQEYEREEAEFAREMNTTKIAFSAYRNAVLHLIHHQNYIKKKKGEDDGEQQEDGDGGGDNDDEDGGNNSQGQVTEEEEDDEEDANLRMTILEEAAKCMVETKAKACFQAVSIAKDFMERGSERQLGRIALFQELLNTSHGNDDNDDVNDMHDAAEEILQNLVEPSRDVHVVNMEPKLVQEETELLLAKVTKPKETKKKELLKKNKRAQTFVKRKISSRHDDCILATLPKFQYRNVTAAVDDLNEKENETTPASYRTTSWIGNMIQWRSQRRTYKGNSFRKCGCPDCSKEMRVMSI